MMHRRPLRRLPPKPLSPPPPPAPVYKGPLVYDRDLNALVPKYGRNRFDWNEKRSDLACPAVHPGSMPEIQSMVDGRRYDTRRNYEKSVLRAGCEIVGYDKPEVHERVVERAKADKEADQRRKVEQHVLQAWDEAQSRVPSYGPEARRLLRKQRRQARETIC